MIEWIIDSVMELIFAIFEEGDNRGERIARKLLPILLMAFVAVILGIIWILER